MNCPSRTDEPLENNGWNQSPPRLAADLTTRQDMNGMVNLRALRGLDLQISSDHSDEAQDRFPDPPYSKPTLGEYLGNDKGNSASKVKGEPSISRTSSTSDRPEMNRSEKSGFLGYIYHAGSIVAKFGRFVGPGFMVSVAYIDPGNYSTDVAAGASTRFKLLFIVLMSNVFAILLQSLAVRLGTVTGLNLAEHCRAHLPRWLNITLYVMGEGAIIATDIAEVSCV